MPTPLPDNNTLLAEIAEQRALLAAEYEAARKRYPNDPFFDEALTAEDPWGGPRENPASETHRHYILGDLFEQIADTEEAVDLLHAQIRLYPDEPALRVNLADWNKRLSRLRRDALNVDQWQSQEAAE